MLCDGTQGPTRCESGWRCTRDVRWTVISRASATNAICPGSIRARHSGNVRERSDHVGMNRVTGVQASSNVVDPVLPVGRSGRADAVVEVFRVPSPHSS